MNDRHTPPAAEHADEWTVAIRDVTPFAHQVHALVRDGDLAGARALLPRERPYPYAAAQTPA